jgi:dienelactone hydrolase
MSRYLLVLILLGWSGLAAASDVAGWWAGTATIGGEVREMRLEIVATANGLGARYDLPALALESIPLRRFNASDGALSAPHQLEARREGDAIVGTLSPLFLHGRQAQIALRRTAPPAPVASERPVRVASRGITLHGTLVSPLAPGRHPALVSLHGSGPSTRWLALGRARRFASAGYATLIFDKPGSGESGGDWTMSSLDDLARDAIAALDFLRAQPEVDGSRVGLWGHSQAGNVISRTAGLGGRFDFALVLAGGGATPRDVEIFGYRGNLARAGMDAAATAEALAWVDDYLAYVASGVGYEALVARIEAAPWRRALGIGTVYPEPVQQPFWSWVATYRPAQDITRMRMPVLLLFAGRDENSPSGPSLAAWRAGLEAGGNRDVTARLFAGAEHHFLLPSGERWPVLAPDWFETQFGWLDRVTDRNSP